tara:strand:- start:273 stop:1208 length:936 start_codon:yes stop_codon:yes gene_type:complete
MTILILTIISVFGYILIGFITKKINILPDSFYKIYNFAAFNILLPIALITNFWKIKFPDIIIHHLIISFFGPGILIFILGFYISKKLLKFKTDDSALFGLGSCFGNSVAFGIPLIYSILGPVNSMPYMILVLFHGFIHFSYTTLIIEGYRNRNYSYLIMLTKTLAGLSKNIVLIGMFIGILLNYFLIPFPTTLQGILLPITKVTLPAVLISLGMTLGSFNIATNISSSLILTGLKNFLFPVLAFLISKYIFAMPKELIFIITMAAALPSGSQTFYFSYRYNSLQQIISANIVISTIVSFFTLSSLIILFNY